MKHRVIRLLRAFEKNGDALAGEVELKKQPKIEVLRKLFRVDGDNPMYDCYPVTDKEARVLSEYTGGASIDTKRYDYFLECDAI